MAAAVAADVVTLQARQPYLAETRDDLLLRLAEADIRLAAALVRRLIGLAVVDREEKGAGKEIGEMRAGALRHRAALLPEQVVMCAVEGDDDQLLARGRVRRRFVGQNRRGDEGRGKKGEERETGHGKPRQFALLPYRVRMRQSRDRAGNHPSTRLSHLHWPIPLARPRGKVLASFSKGC